MLVQTFGMANTTPPTTLCRGWPVMCDLIRILGNTIMIICFINFCTTQACQIPPIPVLASYAALRISKFRMSVLFSWIPLYSNPLSTARTVTWQVKNFGARTTMALTAPAKDQYEKGDRNLE